MAESEFLKSAIVEAAAGAAEGDIIQDDLFNIIIEGNREAAAPFKSGVAKGRGRPAGAVNKKTMAMAAYIMRQYRNPIEVMAAGYSTSAEDFLKQIGINLEGLKPQERNQWLWQAMQMQVSLMGIVAKYVVPQMPSINSPNGGTGIPPMQVNIDLNPQGKDVSVCSHTHVIDAKSTVVGDEASDILDLYTALSDENSSEIK